MVTRPKSCPLLRFYVSTRTHLEKMSKPNKPSDYHPFQRFSLCWLIAKKSGEQKPAVVSLLPLRWNVYVKCMCEYGWLCMFYICTCTSHGGVASSATHSLLSKAAYTALRSEHQPVLHHVLPSIKTQIEQHHLSEGYNDHSMSIKLKLSEKKVPAQ